MHRVRRQSLITRTIKSVLPALAAFAFLPACSWDVSDPAKPWFYPRAGARLSVLKPIRIPADHAGLYFQHGASSTGRRSRFDPYCKIRLRNVKNTTQIIQPGAFLITSSGRHTELVAALSRPGLAPISAKFTTARFTINRNEAPSDVTETIQMDLSSKTQPEVIRLVCGGVEDYPGIAEPPSLAEMQESMRPYMSLKVQ